MADSRHPGDPQRTVNRHFYLPPFGSFGEAEYEKYNEARENLDAFLRSYQDKFYTQPRIWDYALDVPDISSFYDLPGIPHWRTLRGFWKFEDELNSPRAIDESVYGHDGVSRWTARIMPNAWKTIESELSDEWPVGFFLKEGDACIETRTLDNEVDQEGLGAIIPGALHQYPVNPVTGLRELTVEFWWSPTIDIVGANAKGEGGTYVNQATIFSKLSRWVITNDFRWISDEMTLSILPPDPDCLYGSGPLSMNTHRFDPKFFPQNQCDYSDWGYCQSPQASWQKNQWYYVAATWSERLGTRITVNGQRDLRFGADETAIPNNPPFRFKDKGMPADGFLSNLMIGNYHDRWKTQQGIDMLFSNLRISNKVRSDKEILFNYNSGKGRFLESDEFTIGLWPFLEGEGKYSRNLHMERPCNPPIYRQEGMVKTGYISQPLPEETSCGSSESSGCPSGQLGPSSSYSSVSGQGTYAARFVAESSHYLDCGDEFYLNMQTFGGEVAAKMSVVTGIKREGLGTRQTIISKFSEPDQKQFWFGINENDQLEVVLGKGVQPSEATTVADH